MKTNSLKILILLHNDIFYDARVIRQANASSEQGKVTIFCVSSIIRRPTALSSDIALYQVKYPLNYWQTIKRHLIIHREYDFIYQIIAQKGELYDKVIANDLPTLRSAIVLKKKGLCNEVIYDTHEIYTETIKQFFPAKNSMNFVKRFAANLLILLMVFLAINYEKKALKNVDKMITVNNSLASFFAQKYKIVKPSVVRSIPDIPMDEIKSVNYRSLYKWSNDSIILIYQGNLNPGRGLHTILETMSALSEHYKLVIVGEGPLKDEFQKLTKELNLDLKVKHLGQVPNNELVSYTRGADIGLCLIEPVNLSKKLSLPNKIFEYIHAGIPVLGSELPEIKQIINMYNCGEIAALEINKIVDQIVKMSRSDYKLGLKLAQEALTWENEKQELLAVLSD